MTDYDWYAYRVPSITGGGMQNQSVLPLESGGPLTPSGGFKAGAWFEQEVNLIPRLEGDIGLLLMAALGNVTSITGQKYSNAGWEANVGATGHLFRFNPDNHADLPYLGARTKIPGVTSASNRGILGYDCRVSGLRLTIPGAGLVTSRIGVLGRVPQMPNTASVNSWTYANSDEGSTSIAHSGRGSLLLSSNAPQVTGLSIDFLNNMDRAFAIGSYFLLEPTVLTRAVRMRASMRWQNSDLWSLIYNGGATNPDWSNLPYFLETLGSVRGFFFEAQAPGNMPGLNVPYAIRVMANNVMLSCDPGSLNMQAGGIIEFVVNIDVLQPTDGSDYVQIALDNKQPVGTYDWPTPTP